MLSYSVKVRHNNLPRIAKRLPRQVGDIASGAARHGVKIAKDRAPVLTGQLRSRIYAETKGLEAKLISPVVYAAVAEFGGVNRAPHPYMRPASLAMQLYIRKELTKLAGRMGRL